MSDDLVFHLTDENGAERAFEMLATFENYETLYGIYTDHSFNGEGGGRIYASVLKYKDGHLRLVPIESEAEWAMIEAVLENLQKEE